MILLKVDTDIISLSQYHRRIFRGHFQLNVLSERVQETEMRKKKERRIRDENWHMSLSCTTCSNKYIAYQCDYHFQIRNPN